MAVYATNGAKVYIGGTKASQSTDFVSSDFAAVSWTEIKDLENIGSLGDTSEAVDFTAVGDSRTRIQKGSRSAGTLELVCGINYADAGQTALVAAEKSIHDYAFRIVFNDAPVGGDPSERLFVGKVMSASEQLDGANSIMKLNASITVNSNVVRIDAAA